MQDGLSELISAGLHVAQGQDTPAPVAPVEPITSPPADSTSGAAPASSEDLVVAVVDVAGPPLPAMVPTTASAVVAAQGPVPAAQLPTTGSAHGAELLVAAVLLFSGAIACVVASTPCRRRAPRPAGLETAHRRVV